ncbi:MAG: hypothetical protein KA469_02055 [Phycisphaerae bacterium]|nr:hypothetical protein [Phycisphaerae bacterium]
MAVLSFSDFPESPARTEYKRYMAENPPNQNRPKKGVLPKKRKQKQRREIKIGEYDGNVQKGQVMESEITIKIIEICLQALVPLLLFFFGILFLRKVEGVKTQIERQSHFTKKWSDLFFKVCQSFLGCVERIMALLSSLQQLEDPNNERGTRYQEECSDRFLQMAELELKIRRMTLLAPQNGEAVNQATSSIFGVLGNLVRNRQGNFDVLYIHIADFNKAARRAHNEMIQEKILAGENAENVRRM